MAVCQMCCLALVSVSMLSGVCCGGQVFRPHLGQNITLTCQVSNKANITAAWWARPDLGQEYVFYYRDEQSDTEIQAPSFKGRVELAQSELKDGNLSTVLMNVSSDDYGEYTCGFKERREGAVVKNESTCIIILIKPGAEEEHHVGGDTESEHPVNGHSTPPQVGLAAAAAAAAGAAGGVAVLLVAAAVCVAVWRYKRRTHQRSERPAADEAGKDQPMCPSAV